MTSMHDHNERHIEDGTLPEAEVVEVEPNKKAPDIMLPIIDIEAIRELIGEECDKWAKQPIPEA